MFPSDEIVKAQLAVMFSSSSIALLYLPAGGGKKAGDTASIPTIEADTKEEMQMADWRQTYSADNGTIFTAI